MINFSNHATKNSFVVHTASSCNYYKLQNIRQYPRLRDITAVTKYSNIINDECCY